MNGKIFKHPCEFGLTPECFKAYPSWARGALAYRIINVVLPKEVLKVFPGLLGRALIAPGVEVPEGLVLPVGVMVAPDVSFPPGWRVGDPPPPGVVIPPGTEFPPGWRVGDPPPPGVVIPPGTEFPPGWRPGDPPPPGVVIPPGTEFPPGWTPADPMPPGVIFPPRVYPTPPDTGASPPIFVAPWEPGPVHRIVPPLAGIWVQRFDNNFWAPPVEFESLLYFVWQSPEWVVIVGDPPPQFTEDARIGVKTGTTWYQNFRPTQARITFTGGTSPIKFNFYGGYVFDLGESLDAVSPQVIDLDFSAGVDIRNFSCWNLGVHVSNIEFRIG